MIELGVLESHLWLIVGDNVVKLFVAVSYEFS
jgi:hypothetical protein